MQLTWPVDRDENSITQNLLFHKPYIQTAQAAYKQAILQHPCRILRQVARAGLPAVAQSQRERSMVDDSIINVVLYLIRNVAMIQKPDHSNVAEDETEISRSATIDAFQFQGIFDLLLTIGSGISDEYATHDLELLDVLFHLVKGINVERLFMDKEELVSSNAKELQSLIGKEQSMHLSYARRAPSRHNRFGTMTWMKRHDGKMATLVGQTACINDESTLYQMDKHKKWKRPRRPIKRGPEDPLTEFNGKIALTNDARKHLLHFIELFLDSSFNPLFLSVRRSIEREVPRLQHYHTRQYFFLISWFLRAETGRRRKQAQDKVALGTAVAGDESFGLVANVLTQETFVLLLRRMQDAHDNRTWQDVNACMKCFSQILQTVQAMSESSHEDDQEIAENTLSRIFYEQTTHDQITTLLRTFKDQGFGYLDSLTDLSHVFIRTLESYSKQNVDMQVRSMRRQRKKKAERDEAQGTSNNVDRALEEGDQESAQRASSERRFDFMRFSAKFVNQGTVDTFIAFLRYYKELGDEQLKRAHRFFYRAAFKMELSVYLFRADIVLLFQRMIRGPDGMDQEDPMFKEWKELARQIFRQLVKKLQARPALAVELLFSKIPSTVYYLEHGQEKEMPNSTPRPPADLEVKPGMEADEEIGVVVSALINQSKTDHLVWLKRVLISAREERKTWGEQQSAQPSIENPVESGRSHGESSLVVPEGPAGMTLAARDSEDPKEQAVEQDAGTKARQPSPILVRADTPERRQAMQRDRHLRLLLTLCSFERLDITQSDVDRDGVLTSWTLPPSLTSSDLQTSHDLIARFEFSPPIYEDGKTAEDFLRRKHDPLLPKQGTRDRRGINRGDHSDSEGDSIHSDDETLFPAGGPTAQKADYEKKKKKSRRPGKHGKELLDEDTFEARKAAKIKSQLTISLSDDEDDEDRDRAFFEREAELRKYQAREVQKQSLRLRGLFKDGEQFDGEGGGDGLVGTAGTTLRIQESRSGEVTHKRKANDDEASRHSDDENGVSSRRPAKRKKRETQPSASASSTASDSDDLDLLSQEEDLPRASRRSRPVRQRPLFGGGNPDEESETDTPPSSQRPSSGYGNGPLSKAASVDVDEGGRGASGSDKENQESGVPSAMKGAPTVTKTVRRGPFIVESDSDE